MFESPFPSKGDNPAYSYPTVQAAELTAGGTTSSPHDPLSPPRRHSPSSPISDASLSDLPYTSRSPFSVSVSPTPSSMSHDSRRSQHSASHPWYLVPRSSVLRRSSDESLRTSLASVTSHSSSNSSGQLRVIYQHSLRQQRHSPLNQYGSPHTLVLGSARPSAEDRLATVQRCIIPGCQYPAYYNVSDEEQTEYCGHAHELKAIATGLVMPCAMCKSRPRRSGERVCGPICRERERVALPVQGSYFGVPMIRLELTRREPT